ncbi:MAG TPA: glycosyltransferase family 2 protein [Polyangiaceae bacterium]|nr:glycosyltransferase family 2 protein [Polyangiaceae bacterium]
MRVSVIVVNWNGLEMTTNALRSLAAHADGLEYEVIVVDNGSVRDDSRRELPRRFPGVALLVNTENEGFSRACNRAARLARGEYLLFLNNDTLQTQAALRMAAEYLERETGVGALGILHLDGSESRAWQPSAFRFPRPLQDVLASLGLGRLTSPIQDYEQALSADVDWVCGSFLMVRRSVWEAVGEFDERFFVYDEDIDWCLRARREGVRVRYWPGTSMIHLGAASGPGLRDKTFMHFRSRLSYYAKNASLPWAVAFYAAMSARLTASSLFQLSRLATGKGDVDAVRERLRRLGSFLSLRSSRAGVSGA